MYEHVLRQMRERIHLGSCYSKITADQNRKNRRVVNGEIASV